VPSSAWRVAWSPSGTTTARASAATSGWSAWGWRLPASSCRRCRSGSTTPRTSAGCWPGSASSPCCSIADRRC
jgi:hypothetical protein